MCSFDAVGRIPKESRIITSDDVFDFMLNLRCINEGIDQRREELFEEYQEAKYAKFQMHSMEDYERLKRLTQRGAIQSQSLCGTACRIMSESTPMERAHFSISQTK